MMIIFVKIRVQRGHWTTRVMGPPPSPAQNWGLLLYMKRTSDEEVRDIEDHVIEYLLEMVKIPSIQKKLLCFVCNRKSRDNKHDIQDCVQNVEVFVQEDGSLRYIKG